MSTMMPPGMMPPGLDAGGGGPAPPPDPAMLQALLSGGMQGGPPGPDLGPMGGGPSPGGDPMAGLGGDPTAGGGVGPDGGPMSAVDHIQAAMKHLMMAMTQSQDDQMGHGITKGMATLQGLLSGDAKQKLATRGG